MSPRSSIPGCWLLTILVSAILVIGSLVEVATAARPGGLLRRQAATPDDSSSQARFGIGRSAPTEGGGTLRRAAAATSVAPSWRQPRRTSTP